MKLLTLLFAFIFLPLLLLSNEAQVSWPANVAYFGQTAKLKANSSRCLSAILYTLSVEFQIPLSFEDVPITFAGDYIDITSPLYHPKSDDDHALIPRGGALQFSFEVEATHKINNPELILRKLLQEYKLLNYPGIYSIVHVKSVWHIVPAQTLDVNGRWISVTPLMDTVVSLPYSATRTNQDVLNAVFNQIKISKGITVFVGSRVSHNYLQASFASNSRSASARELLEDTFTNFSSHELWLLQCDPRSNLCALNIF